MAKAVRGDAAVAVGHGVVEAAQVSRMFRRHLSLVREQPGGYVIVVGARVPTFGRR
jgi:hypothetical protein